MPCENNALIDARWDFGVATVDQDLIADFGALGYDASGSISVAEIEALGYPAETRPIPRSRNGGQTDTENFPFDGLNMWRSIGDFLGEDGDLHGMENEMTGGCSGGPWITPDDHVAVGLNSHRLVPHDNRMFSPLFDADFLLLLEWLGEKGAI